MDGALWSKPQNMTSDMKVTTNCDWCLREAPVLTIEERLWRFWGTISNEDPLVVALRNICGDCTSRYDGFSRYIENCKINESVVERVLKSEPILDIEYYPLIKEEFSEKGGTTSSARRGNARALPKSPAQRTRECRERKKKLRQPKPPPKPASQRSREYRERLKRLKSLADAISTVDSLRPPPKSPSQRHKEYRERRKRLRLAEAISAVDSSRTSRPPPKSASQRNKEYRERQKKLNLAEGSTCFVDVNSQRCRNYRENRKLARLNRILMIDSNAFARGYELPG